MIIVNLEHSWSEMNSGKSTRIFKRTTLSVRTGLEPTILYSLISFLNHYTTTSLLERISIFKHNIIYPFILHLVIVCKPI